MSYPSWSAQGQGMSISNAFLAFLKRDVQVKKTLKFRFTSNWRRTFESNVNVEKASKPRLFVDFFQRRKRVEIRKKNQRRNGVEKACKTSEYFDIGIWTFDVDSSSNRCQNFNVLLLDIEKC